MLAIYKRDIRSYFVTPIGYVFLAIFYAIASYYFFGYQLYSGSADFSYLFNVLFSIVIFISPLLTMKMFSEEKRHRTDQALITAPVSLIGIVLGKYFATLTVFILALTINFVYLGIVMMNGAVELGVFLGHCLGLFLVGASLCAAGMFVSVLTESQVIAAIGTIGVGIFFLLIDSVGNMLGGNLLTEVCNYLSFYMHYQDFATGLLNVADVIFFLSIIIFFNFLTIRVLEKRRWS